MRVDTDDLTPEYPSTAAMHMIGLVHAPHFAIRLNVTPVLLQEDKTCELATGDELVMARTKNQR